MTIRQEEGFYNIAHGSKPVMKSLGRSSGLLSSSSSPSPSPSPSSSYSSSSPASSLSSSRSLPFIAIHDYFDRISAFYGCTQRPCVAKYVHLDLSEIIAASFNHNQSSINLLSNMKHILYWKSEAPSPDFLLGVLWAGLTKFLHFVYVFFAFFAYVLHL